MEAAQQYSAAEMERMMKVQDVLLQAMAKKITWWQAAEILGVTDWTMRRWREEYRDLEDLSIHSSAFIDDYTTAGGCIGRSGIGRRKHSRR